MGTYDCKDFWARVVEVIRLINFPVIKFMRVTSFINDLILSYQTMLAMVIRFIRVAYC
jgi:hypothetical protein